jgi:predicted site-specific integrase-resolvase
MATEMTVIPLPDAAQRLGIAPDVLTRLVANGTINLRTVRTSDGKIMLSQEDIERMAKAIALRDKIWKQVARFEDEVIGIREARDTYNVPDQTIYRCIEKGYIRANKTNGAGRGKKRMLNRADVAYVAALAKHLRGGRGHRLFGPDTIPPHALEPASS